MHCADATDLVLIQLLKLRVGVVSQPVNRVAPALVGVFRRLDPCCFGSSLRLLLGCLNTPVNIV
jgi:hypothetical protein